VAVVAFLPAERIVGGGAPTASVVVVVSPAVVVVSSVPGSPVVVVVSSDPVDAHAARTSIKATSKETMLLLRISTP
jgi:hypothetical protein